MSLQTGDPEAGYTFTWAFDTYVQAIKDYHEQFLRSFLYAGLATVVEPESPHRVPACLLHGVQGRALEELHAAACSCSRSS